jgi:orotate phosphoribosyltransferase
MTEDIFKSLPARQGHFLLESGFHTDLWFNLDALFVVPKDIEPLVRELASCLRSYKVSGVCGPLMGGAFLANAVASELGCRFYYTEPLHVKNSPRLFSAEYRLPAGLLKNLPGERLAVVDDMISAGSSVRATIKALTDAGASTIVIGTLMLVGSTAQEYFSDVGIPIEALTKRIFNLWKPDVCPLCSAGISLVDPNSFVHY